jgi:hypothetical protein
VTAPWRSARRTSTPQGAREPEAACHNAERDPDFVPEFTPPDDREAQDPDVEVEQVGARARRQNHARKATKFPHHTVGGVGVPYLGISVAPIDQNLLRSGKLRRYLRSCRQFRTRGQVLRRIT